MITITITIREESEKVIQVTTKAEAPGLTWKEQWTSEQLLAAFRQCKKDICAMSPASLACDKDVSHETQERLMRKFIDEH